MTARSPYHFLVASYTDSIVTLEFDPTHSPPVLKQTSSLKIGHHPSWIAEHPTDPSVVFTASEETNGKAFALKVDSQGSAQIVASIPSEGADPCTLVATEEELIIGNVSGINASTTAGQQSQFLIFTIVLLWDCRGGIYIHQCTVLSLAPFHSLPVIWHWSTNRPPRVVAPTPSSAPQERTPRSRLGCR
jgi:hypothetical protein